MNKTHIEAFKKGWEKCREFLIRECNLDGEKIEALENSDTLLGKYGNIELTISKRSLEELEELKKKLGYEHIDNDIMEPDEFFHCAIYPMRKIIKVFVKNNLKINDNIVTSIYLNYDFYSNNLKEICKEFFGFQCSADKARFLINCYIKWKSTGELPEMDWTQEYTYHYPEFGTLEQWMDLIQGLYYLYYGRRGNYIEAIEILKIAEENVCE